MEIAQLIIDAVGTIALPAVIFFVTTQATDALKNREINTKYVELAITILTGDSIEEDPNLERWARNVLEQYSPIPMPEDIVIKAKSVQ
jgi:uncharacterized protein (UPF0147 family)